MLARRNRTNPAGPHCGVEPGAHQRGASFGASVGLAATAPRHCGRPRPARPVLLGRRRPRPQRHGRARRQCRRRGWDCRGGLHRRGRRAARGPTPPNCGRTSPRCSRIASPWTSGSPTASASTRSAAARRPTCPGSDVTVDNEASDTATVLEIRAPDEIGLLHRITRALFDSGARCRLGPGFHARRNGRRRLLRTGVRRVKGDR